MKIYCVGIGGIGLSGVAQILKSQGNEIIGADNSPSEITEALENNGIKYLSSHTPENIDDSVDLLIYSEAVSEINPERKKAKELGIREINYAQALGMVSKEKQTIAITGTHGKTTTTGMLSCILLKANLDPRIIIGSKMDILGNKNFRDGQGKWFLTEACEYRENFKELSPKIVLINNLDPDHLDYFRNEENYFNAFQRFAEKIPEEGTLVMFESDQDKINLSKIKASVKIIPEEHIKKNRFNLKVPGKHNQRNAFAAQAVAEILILPRETIISALENFKGTWRRFEYKGEINGAKIYDDYGHHPTEITATIQAAREAHPDKSIITVFQPHQYSRTRQFFDQFKTAFRDCNEVWITDIYQARDTEEDIKSVSAEELADAINNGQLAKYVPLNQLAEKIKDKAQASQIYLVMGAGNIHRIFEELGL